SLGVELADRRYVRVEKSVLDRLVDDSLREARRMQVRRLLRLHELAMKPFRRNEKTDAKTWREHLRERSHVHDTVRVQRLQRRQRVAAIRERTVWIVLEHEQTVGCDARKRLPPLECNAPAGRILKIRETVQKASVLRECRRELARNRSFVVRRNGHELRRAQGAGLGSEERRVGT